MAARLLIIEDNPVSLQLTRHLLEDRGYAVLMAEDPTRGIALIRQSRPDLVICDLQLPVMNGYEVLQVLQQDPTCSGIPVLAVTAYPEPGDDSQALAAGFRGYIRKPIQPKDFLRLVEEFIAPGLRAPQSSIPVKPRTRYGKDPRRRR
jgi:two-component system cell cycle response regulator DivK